MKCIKLFFSRLATLRQKSFSFNSTKTDIINDLEVHETMNICDRNQPFGASCADIKVA